MNEVFAPPFSSSLPLSLETRLREEISERDRRAQLFGEKMLRHPVWEMLLHLGCTEFDGRPISVSSLCNFIHCPQSTVLRYMRDLEDEGVLQLQQDPTDRRRTFVFLTEETKQLLSEHFSQ